MAELYATSTQIAAEIDQLTARVKFLKRLIKIVLEEEENARLNARAENGRPLIDVIDRKEE